MSQYKLSDKVLIDGKWWKVVENWKHKDTSCVENPSRSYDVRPIGEIEHLIEAHEKYVPKLPALITFTPFISSEKPFPLSSRQTSTLTSAMSLKPSAYCFTRLSIPPT